MSTLDTTKSAVRSFLNCRRKLKKLQLSSITNALHATEYYNFKRISYYLHFYITEAKIRFAGVLKLQEYIITHLKISWSEIEGMT